MRHGDTARQLAGSRNRRRGAVRTVAVAVSVVLGTLVTVAPAASGSPAWSISASPNPADQQNNHLFAVSCPSTTSCFAVGNSDDRSTLAEHWNGTSWSLMTAAAGFSAAVDPTLTGVSCPSTTSCFAVGYYYYPQFPPSSSKVRPLIEHWNGVSWSVMARPVRAGARDVVLSSVSCQSTASCFAVGYSTVGGASQTLVERWNGRSWSIVSSPTRNQSSSLQGVSCPGAATCYAVGSSAISTLSRVSVTLIEHWNGRRWSIVSSPNSFATTNELRRVSCPSTNNCFAVGLYVVGDVSRPLVEHWNENRWSIMTSPSPAGKTFVTLTGVSCPSTTRCVAVGSDATSSDATHTLIEEWNGSRWSITPSPNPSNATHAELTGVSCHPPTSCFAVGFYGARHPDQTLIERYA